MTRKSKKGTPEPTPGGPLVIETFRPVGAYEIGQLRRDQPSCFNGIVEVKRYRITIEEIEEPPEVIGQRIQDLWDACDNHHHVLPLRAAAKAVGWELEGVSGRKRKT